MPYRNGQVVEWKHKIQLKDLLTEDDSDENVKLVAMEMHTRLVRESQEHFEGDLELEDIAEEFYSIAVVSDPDLVGWFNSLLENLYDWADLNLVWIN